MTHAADSAHWQAPTVHAPHREIAGAVQHEIDFKTKPRGALGQLESLALSDAQREAIQVELEAGRDRGMLMLRSYQERGPEAVATFAPAFGELKDCAICNAALQMDFNTD